MLYLIWFLHQTTTIRSDSITDYALYLIWFLHQTTTCRTSQWILSALYLIWFLHQTTTTRPARVKCTRCILSGSYIKPQQMGTINDLRTSCILSGSYIKPQHRSSRRLGQSVVSYLVPTSNHNHFRFVKAHDLVVSYLVPTSNHNG